LTVRKPYETVGFQLATPEARKATWFMTTRSTCFETYHVVDVKAIVDPRILLDDFTSVAELALEVQPPTGELQVEHNIAPRDTKDVVEELCR
jgi:hypothetical protein